MSVWIKLILLTLTLSFTLNANAHSSSTINHSSGTLPVVHIDTADGAAITSKEVYVTASMYIEGASLMKLMNDEERAMNNSSGGLASADNPILMKIRGRGNWTWEGFEKKPYKVKFSTPMSVLGMAENRHWALMSHPDDGTGFLRNALAFEMGRMIGLPFTPHQQPVEMVLNGEYVGVYVVTETVRVDPGRVEIVGQEDGETDEEKVKGGWLVEIDNYEDVNQISFDVTGLPIDEFRITWHTPEMLSSVQYDYLYGQFSDILDCVYTPDKSSQQWEDYLDIDMLARYYVVAEIIDHVEAFFGSTFLYKASADGKWMTGPLWDIGHGLNGWHDKNKFIYEGLSWGNNLLTEICKFPRFQERVKQIYAQFMREHSEEIFDFVDSYCAMMNDAYHANYLRWNYYGDISGSQYAESAKQTLRSKIAFLDKAWGRETKISASLMNGEERTMNNSSFTNHYSSGQRPLAVYDLQGRKVVQRMNTDRHGKGTSTLNTPLSSLLSPLSTLKPGIYILNGKKIMIR